MTVRECLVIVEGCRPIVRGSQEILHDSSTVQGRIVIDEYCRRMSHLQALLGCDNNSR